MFYGLNCELHFFATGSLEVFHVASTGSLPVTSHSSSHGLAMPLLIVVLLRHNCYLCSRWCLRQNCMNQADYKKKMDGTKYAGKGSKFKESKDVRVALSALILDDEYCILEE
eukprot:11950631-Ditylum_brightwellii.AAC.1